MQTDEELLHDAERLEALTGRALAVSHLFAAFEDRLQHAAPGVKIDWALAARHLRRAGGVVPTAVDAYLSAT